MHGRRPPEPMEGELATLIGQFHHIDADVLEKISPDEMAAILSSSDFHCDEEIIARQVRKTVDIPRDRNFSNIQYVL